MCQQELEEFRLQLQKSSSTVPNKALTVEVDAKPESMESEDIDRNFYVALLKGKASK